MGEWDTKGLSLLLLGDKGLSPQPQIYTLRSNLKAAITVVRDLGKGRRGKHEQYILCECPLTARVTRLLRAWVSIRSLLAGRHTSVAGVAAAKGWLRSLASKSGQECDVWCALSCIEACLGPPDSPGRVMTLEKPSAWATIFSVFRRTIQGITTWMAKPFQAALLLQGHAQATSYIITAHAPGARAAHVTVAKSGHRARLRLLMLQNSESWMFMSRVKKPSQCEIKSRVNCSRNSRPSRFRHRASIFAKSDPSPISRIVSGFAIILFCSLFSIILFCLNRRRPSPSLPSAYQAVVIEIRCEWNPSSKSSRASPRLTLRSIGIQSSSNSAQWNPSLKWSRASPRPTLPSTGMQSSSNSAPSRPPSKSSRHPMAWPAPPRVCGPPGLIIPGH